MPIKTVLYRYIPLLLENKVIDRGELITLLESKNSIEYYGAAEEISINANDHADLPDTHKNKIGTYQLPQPFVCTWDGAIVCGTQPIAFTNSGQIIAEAIGKPRMVPLNIIGSANWSQISNCLFPQMYGSGIAPERELDTAVLLHNKWSSGYAHWVQDDLPKLQGLKEYEQRTGEKPRIIFNPEPTTFQVKLMEMLDYNESRFLGWDGRPTAIKKLVIPSARRYGIQSRDAMNWLRDRILDKIDYQDSQYANRVYISRSDAYRRKVINEDEVMDALSGLGFERYIPTNHSVREQIAIFNQADVIVGPHGANLTNTLFSSDATLIEIFGDHTHAVQFITCNLIGNEYRAFQAKPVGIDMWVDVDRLTNVVCDVVD